jgi:hypothetical protein
MAIKNNNKFTNAEKLTVKLLKNYIEYVNYPRTCVLLVYNAAQNL